MIGVLDKVSKTDDTVTVHFFDNGYMVEVSGRDSEGDWVRSKISCMTLDEVFEVIKHLNSLPLDR